MLLSGITTILFGCAYYWKIHVFAYFVVIQVCPFAADFRATCSINIFSSLNIVFGLCLELCIFVYIF